MLPDIEQLADDYCPTVTYKRINYMTVCYTGLDRTIETFYSNHEILPVAKNITNMTSRHSFDNGVFTFKIYSLFIPKKSTNLKGSSSCHNCSSCIYDMALLCRKCWIQHPELAQDLVKQYHKKALKDEQDEQIFWNQPVQVYKKLHILVGDNVAFLKDTWAELNDREVMGRLGIHLSEMKYMCLTLIRDKTV